MSDKELIKEEIERRIEKYGPDFKTPYDAMYQLLTLLDFIDSLPEEPASKDLELEEEITRYYKSLGIIENAGEIYEWDDMIANTILTARHFAEWQRKKDQETIELAEEPASKDLIEEIDKIWKTCNPIDEGMGVETANIHIEQFDAIARHFTEWQKKKMMKDAIDATILDVDAQTIEFGLWPEKLLDIKEGDKVKIIVIKEN